MAPPPNSVGIKALAPSVHPMMREVTEDTPADHLEGTMDLLVVLPSKTSVRMTVNRRTPMMDLLIQVTTSNKINPGGHIVLVRNERGSELRYKPSTPIGVLDTTTIEIVPKNQVNEYIIVKKQPANKPANQPFEQTFRLQVHLPRNQLYVMRVGPKTVLQDILDEVCQEKNLDISKYELRHPVNLDEKLVLSNRLGDYGLQQVTVVSRNARINNTSVSSADILAIQQQNEDGRTKGGLDSAFKYSRSSVGDSSVSSESAGSGCGISPSRSDDDSRSISPLPPPNTRSKLKLNTTISNASSSSEASSSFPKSIHSLASAKMDELNKPKKRAAPAPPPLAQETHRPLTLSPSDESVSLRKKDPAKDPPRLSKHQSLPPQNHSRNSSDSSGYHESTPSVQSGNHEPRIERPTSVQPLSSSYGSSALSNGTATSLTNLTSVSSLSSTSLASSNGGIRNKRKAPKPPAGFTLQAQTELEEEFTTTDTEVQASAQNSESKSKSSTDEARVDAHIAKENAEVETDKDEEFVVQTRKPTTQRSSSSMSSLSSPTPPSDSTSSSPLPLDIPTQNSKLKRIVPSPAAALAAAELDRSSNNLATSTLPMPPPRTKPRDSTFNREPEQLQNLQPKPKPRSDRKTNMELDAAELNPALTKSAAYDDARSSAEVVKRNIKPMNKIGVKVLPDNALEEHAKRFSSIPSSNVKHPSSNRISLQHDVQKLSTNNNKLLALNENDWINKNDQILPKKRELASNIQTSSKTNDEPAPLLQSHQKQSIGSEVSFHSQEEYDSDNLEENLELFEVHKNESSQKIKSRHENRIISTSSQNNGSFKSSTTTITKSSSQSFDNDDGSHPPITSPNSTITSVDKKFNSSTQNYKNKIQETTLKNTQRSQSSSSFSNNNSQATTIHEPEVGQLNRWKNQESLHVIETEKRKPPQRLKNKPTGTHGKLSTLLFSPTSAKPSTTNSTTAALLTTKQQTFSQPEIDLSSDNEDSGERVDEVNEINVSSSESEVSYADSGIPTTANVTPSPISLEHDQIQNEKVRDQNNLLPMGSPTEADHSETWREILQSKVEDRDANMEKALESVVHDFKQNDETDALVLQNQKTESNFEMSRPESLKGSSNFSKSESEHEKDEMSPSTSDEEEIRNMQSKKKNISKKVSKSDSFSHNSEYDTKSKRKTFAEKGAISNRNQSHKVKSYLSSSEEDLQKNEPSKRFTSMQNLSSGSSSDVNGKKLIATESRSNGTGKEQKVIRKATSVMGIENLEPEIAQNPDLMQTFQVELEAQFEQWKEQFLQKHLSRSKSGSMDSSSNEEQKVKPTEDPGSVSHTETKELATHADKKEVIDKSFDPETPQIVHSVAGVADLRVRTGTKDENPVLDDQQFKQKSATSSFEIGQSSQEGQSVSESVDNPEEDMSGIQVSQNGKHPDKQVYKYSGPPAIQMGTWGERPRGNISLKNDTDYKMGMGQHDAKGSSNEFKPTLGSIATRVHSFNGGSVASPMLNKSTTLPSTRGTTSTVPKVVSNWKDKVQSSENERKLPTTNEVVDENKKSAVSMPIRVDKTDRKSVSVTNTLERPAKSKANFTINSASSTLERPTKKLIPPTVVGFHTEKNELNQTDKSKHLWLQTSEKQSDEISAHRSLEKPKTSNVSSVTLNGSQPNSNGYPASTLQDKKVFFQGVKPVESPTKEVPLPAVNMKNNIATIQRVFQQKQQEKVNGEIPAAKGQSTREPSPALSTSSSFSSMSSKSSTNNPESTRPETIGGPSQSTLMVQKVLKANSFNLDAFRRTPSPASSGSDRFTPSPTVVDNSSHKVYHSTVTPITHIKNDNGNKAVVIIGGENNSGNNNMYRQQLKVTGTPRESISSTTSQNSVKLHVNGSNEPKSQLISINQHKLAPNASSEPKSQLILINQNKTSALSQNGSSEPKSQMISINQNETAMNPYGITLKSSRVVPKEVNIQDKPAGRIKSELNKRNSGPMQLAGLTPPPPPPPPVMPVEIVGKPNTLSLSSEPKRSPLSSQSSLISPNSDPRADIFSAIKNSGGNFGLKKTGSTMLLR